MANNEIYSDPVQRVRAMNPAEQPVAIDQFDEVLWANIAAGCALVFYLGIMWLAWRGVWQPKPRTLKIIRWIVLFILMLPIAARYHYSHEAILYISAALMLVGVLMKLKQKMGI